ncbi:MAG: cupredoxin domain-containing protein [Nitrososphaeraceae archaeon]
MKNLSKINISILFVMTVLTIQFSTTEIFAQSGSMATLQNIGATYAVSIVPGAAQKDSTYHYYPPQIAVPLATTVAWFNNDFGQPHTVTSGEPGAPDKGSIFNSGIMPATANSFFQYTFDEPGEYVYHCIIHPWRVALVSTSDIIFTGKSFDIGLGGGEIWDISNNPRVLLDLNPKTVPIDGSTLLTYNVTINEPENDNKKLFSHIFNTFGENLPLELVSTVTNETTVYGPDFSATGAYHLQSDFKKDSSYPMTVEIVAVDGKPVDFPIKASFDIKTS